MAKKKEHVVKTALEHVSVKKPAKFKAQKIYWVGVNIAAANKDGFTN